MSYRISELMERIKKWMPLYTVLWAFIVVVMIGCSYAVQTMKLNNQTLDMNLFITYFGDFTSNPLGTLGKCFTGDYIGNTLSWIFWTTIVFFIVIIIGTIRNNKNREFRDIEHGSSDWSKGGEQYKTLSNKKGIILAEHNYLPLDKRGNVNVLIVGRFRFW